MPIKEEKKTNEDGNVIPTDGENYPISDDGDAAEESTDYERNEEIISQSDMVRFENPGDKIQFEFIELTEVATQFKESAPMVRIIDLIDNQEKIMFPSSNLSRLMKNAKIGEKYEVEFVKWQPSAKGNMKIFTMWTLKKKIQI